MFFTCIAEQLVRRAKIQNATVYRFKNFSLEDKKDLSISELEENHQKKLEELKGSHEWKMDYNVT